MARKSTTRPVETSMPTPARSPRSLETRSATAALRIVGRDVDEGLAVLEIDDLGVRHLALDDVRIVRGRAAGDEHGPGPDIGPDRVEDDVLLEDLVIAECAVPGLEDVDAVDPHEPQEGLAEGPEVGAVAEAARGDGDHLAARHEEVSGQEEEGRIEVRRLEPGGLESLSLRRIGPDLPVRGIQDGAVVGALQWGEEAGLDNLARGPDEVLPPYLPLERHAPLPGFLLAKPERRGQGAGELGVDLVARHVDLLRLAGARRELGDQGCGE